MAAPAKRERVLRLSRKPHRHLLATLSAEPGSDGKVIVGIVGGVRYVIEKGRGATWRLYVEAER